VSRSTAEPIAVILVRAFALVALPFSLLQVFAGWWYGDSSSRTRKRCGETGGGGSCGTPLRRGDGPGEGSGGGTAQNHNPTSRVVPERSETGSKRKEKSGDRDGCLRLTVGRKGPR
jgi:hypothetical protein